MASRLQGILQELRERLGQLYGARLERLVLFGSQARGDAAPDSDIDVLVVLQGMVTPGAEISRSGPLIAALSLEYDIVISCVFVSSACYQEEQSPLLLNVRREGVLLSRA
jgi:predicted nucleotidyltransferase